jgi:hypothetical protein
MSFGRSSKKKLALKRRTEVKFTVQQENLVNFLSSLRGNYFSTIKVGNEILENSYLYLAFENDTFWFFNPICYVSEESFFIKNDVIQKTTSFRTSSFLWRMTSRGQLLLAEKHKNPDYQISQSEKWEWCEGLLIRDFFTTGIRTHQQILMPVK